MTDTVTIWIAVLAVIIGLVPTLVAVTLLTLVGTL